MIAHVACAFAQVIWSAYPASTPHDIAAPFGFPNGDRMSSFTIPRMNSLILIAAIVFGVPAIVIALAIFAWMREAGTDRAAARAAGGVRQALGRVARDANLRWLYLTSVLGGGGRGLGVVNLFALIYLTKVIALDTGTTNLMYGALIVFSVPMPLVAGWFADRFGPKPVIVAVYLGGAAAFLVFLAAGSELAGLWIGIVLMGLFTFAESPQLQALLADIAPPSVRDASFAVYFTLAFGIGSLWNAVYGVVLGGWATNSRWSLLGAIRGSAQMISYEVAMGLALIGAILTFGTLDLQAIARAQGAHGFEARAG
jgi:predicted MFS family arabinose efflux permease